MAKEKKALATGKANDMTKRIPSGSRFALFKRLFAAGFNTMFRMNLFTLLTLFPIVAIAFLFFTQTSVATSALPYSSIIGAGYPSIVDIGEIVSSISMSLYQTYMITLMPLAILIGSFLIVGMFYAFRNFVWTEGKSPFKDYFKGLKFNYKQGFFYSLLTTVFATILILLLFYINIYIAANGYNFLAISSLVAFGILAYFAIMIIVYSLTLSTTYDITIAKTLKFAATLSVKLIIQNVIILVLCAVPVLIGLLIPSMFTFVITLFMFIGISYIMLILTIYTQWVFDMVV